MVATSLHYIIGIAIAWFLGYKDKRKYWLGLIAIIPDLDGILFMLLMAAKGLFGFSLNFLESSHEIVMLFAHRGISHSIFLCLAVLLVLAMFKKTREITPLVAILWMSHLFMDYLTAWKMFPLLPISYLPSFFAVVEVFDSILTFLLSVIFGIFVGMSILKKEGKGPIIFGYLFVLAFGFIPSVYMREFNTQTVLLSQLVFWVIVFATLSVKNKKTAKKWIDLGVKTVPKVTLLMIFYIVFLIGNKFYYAHVLDASAFVIEPLEEFAFNYNAHTFEIKGEDSYRVGVISWRGIEEEKTIERFIDHNAQLSKDEVNEYVEAYKKALYVNWFNHPIWNFHKDEQGVVYANIRYAKSYLDNPHMPGPQQGVDIKLENGMLVSYGQSWFD